MKSTSAFSTEWVTWKPKCTCMFHPGAAGLSLFPLAMFRSHGSRAAFSIWNLLHFYYTWPFRVMGISGSVEKFSLNLVFFSFFCLYLNKPCFLPLGHIHLHIRYICIVSDVLILIICIIIHIRVSLLEANSLPYSSFVFSFHTEVVMLFSEHVSCHPLLQSHKKVPGVALTSPHLSNKRAPLLPLIWGKVLVVILLLILLHLLLLLLLVVVVVLEIEPVM